MFFSLFVLINPQAQAKDLATPNTSIIAIYQQSSPLTGKFLTNILEWDIEV